MELGRAVVEYELGIEGCADAISVAETVGIIVVVLLMEAAGVAETEIIEMLVADMRAEPGICPLTQPSRTSISEKLLTYILHLSLSRIYCVNS